MTSEAVRASTTVQPGALTALLGELARAPDATGWSVPASPGEAIGRFEIVREIGRGGFGVVYEAKDTELGRSVAFKAIRAGCCDEVRDRRALAEAEAAARLAHPNIVHLYDVGRCERGPFLIMELLHGESLHDRLARGPLKLRDAVHVAVEITRGLAHAHEQGVVHRDLKPGNVFLCDDGQVKVLDFGLARVFDRRGADGGTPEYMSPEQARGEPGDTRSDVYALGVTVRELLPDPPPAIAKLLVRMTAGDPDARPRDGAEAHAALARIQRALEPRRLWWAGWGLAAVTLAAFGAIALRTRPPPPGRLLTAMADAENATGDPELDGVAELLRAGLDGSRRVSIMARSRLVNLLRQAGGSLPPAIGEPQARTAAREARAQLLILPAVRRAGGGYEVVLRAVNLSRDEPFVVAVETAGAKANVPAALDRLARRLRKALREEAQDAPRGAAGVAELAPENPEALRLFAQGKRLHSEGRFDEALDAFEKASTADPSFMLPRVEILDYARGWVPSRAFYLDERAAKEHVDALRANVHRLPDREQAWLETYLLLSDQRIGNATEELALYDRAIEAWPEDPRPYVAAARKLLMHRADADAARPYLDRAVALAPLDEGWAVDFLLALGRPDDALARARRWAEEQPGRPAFTNLAFVHRVRGEVQESLAAARRSLEFPGEGRVDLLRPFAVGDALDEAEAVYASRGGPPPAWLAMRGRVRDALAAWDTGAPPADDRTGRRIDHQFFRGFLLLPRGDPGAVWAQAQEVFRTGYGWFPCYAWQLAALGDLERAEPLAFSGASDHHVCWRAYDALRTWKRGDREGALAAFSRIYVASSDLFRGEVLSELGRDAEAVELFRAYRRRMGVNIWDGNFDAWNFPRSLFLEAAALERLGERDEAARVLGRLLRLWERADAELPLLARAKALHRRLAAAKGR